MEPKQILKSVKPGADVMLDSLEISSSIAGASLARTWQILFDLLCRSDEVSVSDLNTLSGVIQKLFTCHTTMCSMEQSKHGSQNTDFRQPLSEAVIEDLETQLRLL